MNNYLQVVFPQGQRVAAAVDARTVKVLTADGQPVNGVRSVKIGVDATDGIVRCTLELHAVIREEGPA